MSALRAVSLALVVATAVLLSPAGCGDDDTNDAASLMHLDAGHDAGMWHPPEVTLPAADSGVELWLSEVGLYQDIATKKIAPDLIAFEPRFKLWSDGADKERWLRLPPGEQIDTSDLDHWQFPIGTMLFKQFAQSGKRLETRLIMRTGPAPEDYWMGAFRWN
jgi:hypothetical protein